MHPNPTGRSKFLFHYKEIVGHNTRQCVALSLEFLMGLTWQHNICVFVLKASVTALSNESITIKGKQFFILKMIGRGGSSKVR